MFAPFTEEHAHFRKTVRDFAEKELAPHADEWEEAELFPDEVFRRAGELGILGAHFPEDKGGSGGDYWYSVVKGEELPRCNMAGTVMGLLVQSDMATPVIADVGTPEQIDEFLKPALRGERIAALGVTEPGAGSDVAGILTTARRDGDDYVINGSKTYITNGTRAGFVTLLAKTRPEAGAHGCSFFLVPTDLPGFSVSRKLKKLGNHSSDTAELFLEDVRVPKRWLLGEQDQAFMYLMQSFQTERLIACVSAIAGCFIALDDAATWARDRKVFGKPLIKREYWQQKLVELHIQVEAGKAFTYKCVDVYNHEKYVLKQPLSFETVRLISMAKCYAAETASVVMDQCLQLHGGAGYMDEYKISRAWRDQRLVRVGGGTTETLRYYIAKLMGF